MKRLVPILTLVLSTIFLLLVAPVSAQEGGETLVLDFNRDFGYGGFGGDIQGRFSLRVTSPVDIVRVEYYLDGESVFESTEAPFKWQFSTANFPEGRHTFSATGYKADGTEVQATPFTRTFLSSEKAWGNMGKILVPILILVGVGTFAGVLGPVLLGRKIEHTPGVYGMAGGAICPRCTFPFARSVLAPNLLVGKLVRCPHCGKWSVRPQASAEALRAAEERLSSESTSSIESPSEEEKLRQMIEESRFDE